jgi:predicted RNase H-like HicB family nuclease
MKTNYSMIIQWSDIDQIFVVTIPEFADRLRMPCTHGDTHEDAAQAGLELIETFLEIWEEEGKSIPEPRALVTV